MPSPRRTATIALVAWTFLVWTTRLRNIWTDSSLTRGEQWGRTALAGSFTVLALAVAVGLSRRAPWLRSAVVALAAWTVLVWIVRAVGIALADHDTSFIAVHLVLAVVSIGLAALAVRPSGRPAATAR